MASGIGEDEAIIHNRLYFEKTSDKGLRNLTDEVLWLAMADHTQSAPSEEQKAKLLDTARMDLATFADTQARTRFVMARHLQEVQDSRDQMAAIQTEMEEAGELIASLKLELEKERSIKANKEEYNRLCKLIFKHASKPQQIKSLNQLKKDIVKLEGRKKRMELKTLRRKKQFNLVLQSVQALQSELKADEDDDEDDEDDDDNVAVSSTEEGAANEHGSSREGSKAARDRMSDE